MMRRECFRWPQSQPLEKDFPPDLVAFIIKKGNGIWGAAERINGRGGGENQLHPNPFCKVGEGGKVHENHWERLGKPGEWCHSGELASLPGQRGKPTQDRTIREQGPARRVNDHTMRVGGKTDMKEHVAKAVLVVTVQAEEVYSAGPRTE